MWMIAPAPIERESPAVVAAGDSLFVWGGSNPQDGSPQPTAAAYDAGQGSWTEVAEAPLSPRIGASLAASSDTVVVWGGWSRSSRGLSMLGDGATYDLAVQRWLTLPRAPLGLRTGVAVAVAEGQILLWSGRSAPAPDAPPFADGAIFDIAASSWAPMPPCPFDLPPLVEAATVAGAVVMLARPLDRVPPGSLSLRGGLSQTTLNRVGQMEQRTSRVAVFDLQAREWVTSWSIHGGPGLRMTALGDKVAFVALDGAVFLANLAGTEVDEGATVPLEADVTVAGVAAANGALTAVASSRNGVLNAFRWSETNDWRPLGRLPLTPRVAPAVIGLGDRVAVWGGVASSPYHVRTDGVIL